MMYDLTKEQAEKVREWRNKGTWRWVASRAAEEWPEKKIDSGNQIEGMYLCKEAAIILGEDPWDVPWN
jgi:hypothetical protein